jgi:hypothetical protein
VGQEVGERRLAALVVPQSYKNERKKGSQVG